MNAKKVGQKIKEARLKFGLKQSDLAYRMGISVQSISAFESGRIRPAMKYLVKIAQFTHQPLYFFTGEKVIEAMDRLEKVITELESIKEVLSEITDDE